PRPGSDMTASIVPRGTGSLIRSTGGHPFKYLMFLLDVRLLPIAEAAERLLDPHAQNLRVLGSPFIECLEKFAERPSPGRQAVDRGAAPPHRGQFRDQSLVGEFPQRL